MKEKLDDIQREGQARIAGASTVAELQDVKTSLLGKAGSITAILKEIPTLEPSIRAETGRAANELKNRFTDMIDSRREVLS
ncbi:MAG: hypothetical protein FWG71_11525, partial [Synergistaceae bacterium]|nr:hypothetical protein [Synergistaceae bacterium]